MPESSLLQGKSEYAADFSMPLVIITGAVLGIVGGIVAAFGGAKKSRKIGVVSLVIIFAGAGAIVGPAAYLNFVLDDTFNRLQLNPTENGVEFTEKEQSLLDMTAALYNTCCFEVYDPRCGTRYNPVLDPQCTEADEFATGNVGVDVNQFGGSLSIRDNQLPVRECSDTDACADAVFPDITKTINGITDLLCTCFSSQSKLDAWKTVFSKLDSCTKMKNLVAENVGPVDIPKTPLTFGDLQPTLSVPLGRPPLRPCTPGGPLPCASPIGNIAVVGKMWAPEEIYPPNDKAETPGWSCGFGYAKSVAYTMYLALDQASEVAIYGSFATGGVMAFVVILELMYWCLGGGEEDEEWGGDHYNTGSYN